MFNCILIINFDEDHQVRFPNPNMWRRLWWSNRNKISLPHTQVHFKVSFFISGVCGDQIELQQKHFYVFSCLHLFHWNWYFLQYFCNIFCIDLFNIKWQAAIPPLLNSAAKVKFGFEAFDFCVFSNFVTFAIWRTSQLLAARHWKGRSRFISFHFPFTFSLKADLGLFSFHFHFSFTFTLKRQI